MTSQCFCMNSTFGRERCMAMRWTQCPTSAVGFGICQRRLEMPHARELPRARCAVVPEVRAGSPLVGELVAHSLPRLAAVARALDQLAEPGAGLRGIQPIRIGGRALEVVDLPAPEVGAAEVPAFALSV